MPFPGLTLQVPTRYPPWVNLSLSVYQGPSPEKSRRSGKKNQRPKSGGGGLLRQSNQKCTLQTGTVVHPLGQCCPVLVYPKYVCCIFLRARRIQRGFWPVWSDPGHPLGHGLPTHHSDPLEPVRRTAGHCMRVRKNIHR
jgi:hypothetical protein